MPVRIRREDTEDVTVGLGSVAALTRIPLINIISTGIWHPQMQRAHLSDKFVLQIADDRVFGKPQAVVGHPPGRLAVSSSAASRPLTFRLPIL